jgi:hypothetical protein
MDLLQKLGGRKFWMALLVIGAAMFLEMKSEKGLTPTMAGFLAGIVGTFSMANFATTAKHMTSRRPAEATPPPQGLNNDNAQALINVLGKLGTDIEEVKQIAGNTGKAVVNLSMKGR